MRGFEDCFKTFAMYAIAGLSLLGFAGDTMGAVNDHILFIEMSTTYKFGETGDTPVEYNFDAVMYVDETVASGSVETPNGTIYPSEFDYEDGEIYLNVGVESDRIGILDDFTEGTYTFRVNYIGGGSDSTTVEYALPNGDPIPHVDMPLNAVYPVNYDQNVPPVLTFALQPIDNPNWGFSIYCEPVWEEDARCFEIEELSSQTSSVGPVILSPGVSYKAELNIGQVIWSTNSDGISYVIDTDSERYIYFSTAERGHHFVPNPDVNNDGIVNLNDLMLLASDWLVLN